MELKNRIWMTGNLEWFAYLGDEMVFLGRREVPYPAPGRGPLDQRLWRYFPRRGW